MSEIAALTQRWGLPQEALSADLCAEAVRNGERCVRFHSKDESTGESSWVDVRATDFATGGRQRNAAGMPNLPLGLESLRQAQRDGLRLPILLCEGVSDFVTARWRLGRHALAVGVLGATALTRAVERLLTGYGSVVSGSLVVAVDNDAAGRKAWSSLRNTGACAVALVPAASGADLRDTFAELPPSLSAADAFRAAVLAAAKKAPGSTAFWGAQPPRHKTPRRKPIRSKPAPRRAPLDDWDAAAWLRSRGVGLRETSPGSYRLRCPTPTHADRQPSCDLARKDGGWVWHCFGCGVGGGVIDLVEAVAGVPRAEAKQIILSAGV